MIIYQLTQEEFNKTNKALSEALDVEFLPIEIDTQIFECYDNGWGGKTVGTTGYIYTEEQRKNISLSLTGRKRPGRILSEKHKENIKNSKIGKKLSHECRQKMSETRKNKKHSEESKQKMRESALKREEMKRILKSQTLGN